MKLGIPKGHRGSSGITLFGLTTPQQIVLIKVNQRSFTQPPSTCSRGKMTRGNREEVKWVSLHCSIVGRWHFLSPLLVFKSSPRTGIFSSFQIWLIWGNTHTHTHIHIHMQCVCGGGLSLPQILVTSHSDLKLGMDYGKKQLQQSPSCMERTNPLSSEHNQSHHLRNLVERNTLLFSS